MTMPLRNYLKYNSNETNMINVKEFVNNNYQITELPENIVLLHKIVKDSVGVKYKIRILLDTDEFDPEAEYNSKPVSYIRLEIDEKITLNEIEDMFENAWVALGRKYF